MNIVSINRYMDSCGFMLVNHNEKPFAQTGRVAEARCPWPSTREDTNTLKIKRFFLKK